MVNLQRESLRRRRVSRVMGKGLSAFLAGIVLLLVLGTSALAAQPQTIPELEGIIEENEGKRNLKLAVTGSVEGSRDGYILAYVLPTNDEFAAMRDGDEFNTPLASASKIQGNGKFQLRLDPNSPLLASGLNNIELTFLATDGSIAGIAQTSVEVVQAGKSKNRQFDKSRDVQIAPTGEASPLESGDHADTEGEYESFACSNVILANYLSGYENLYVNPGQLIARDTVAVAGTNTRHATVSPKHTRGSSTRLGYGVSINGGSWGKASGTKTVEVTNSASTTWEPSNAYGTFSYRMDIGLQLRERTCYSFSGIPTSITRYTEPVLFTGGSHEPDKWNNTRYPTHCVPQAKGSWTLDRSTATTWSGGLKLNAVPWIEFNASSRSGWNESTSVTFNMTSTGKFLCGNRDVPGGTPRYIMADWKDR